MSANASGFWSDRFAPVGRGAIYGGIAGSIALAIGWGAVYVLQTVFGVATSAFGEFTVLYVSEATLFGLLLSVMLNNRAVRIVGAVVAVLLVVALGATAVAASLGYLLFFPLLGGVLLGLFGAVLVVLTMPATDGGRHTLGAWIVAGWLTSAAVPVLLALLSPWLPAEIGQLVAGFRIDGVASAIAGVVLTAVFFPIYAPFLLPVFGSFYGAGVAAVGAPDRSWSDLAWITDRDGL